MRLTLLFALATVIALVIETARPLSGLQPLIPNLIVILAVDLGLRHHGAFPALLAFLIGYAADAFSGVHLGLNAFLVTAVYLLSYELSSRLLVTNAIVGAVMVFFGTMLAGLGAVGIPAGRGALDAMTAVFAVVMLQALITAIVSPPIFSMLNAGKRAMGMPLKTAREAH